VNDGGLILGDFSINLLSAYFGLCLANFYRKNIRPDLILHKEQNNLDEQKLACEIKTVKFLNFNDFAFDLQKLVYYKTSRLKFENSVFVYSGEIKEIEDLLKLFLKQKPTSMLDCLHNQHILFALPKSKESNPYQWGIYAIDLGQGINESCLNK
jgi:hypothetical protein